MQKPFSLRNKKVWVAGHRGLVGSATVRRLGREGCEILTVPRERLDLRRQEAVEDWMAAYRPDAVILAAATVGGIAANQSCPADFLYDNLAIASNVIHAAHKTDVRKLLFLGSSCIYPRQAPQPILEDALLSGPLEPTNQWYAVAKIAGIKLCQAYRRQHGRDFIAAMPCNLYGPGDSFDMERSHVIPALMMKFHAARQAGADAVDIWGTGDPLREFLHVDDLADALVFVLENYAEEDFINVGSGTEISIRDLAVLMADITGYGGRLVFNPSRPDGTPRKVMDNSRMTGLGWRPRTALRDGLAEAYAWYLENEVRRDAA